MREKIINNLRGRFSGYEDLIDSVDEPTFANTLDVPKHKSLGEHLWCVVGARESYAKALSAGQWEGFSCSMTSFSKDDFKAALSQSASDALAVIAGVTEWTSEHDELLSNLAEHEVMHEGQIIRHIYGIGGTLPSSWKWA